jgi:tetrapyrrole methylase family protein/MazG family protein
MLCEELGDLLLEVLLHVQIAEENEDFSLEDVVYSISQKLVRRHPHVFGDAIAETPEAVVEQWDRLKSQERGQDSALAGIPPGLPALAQAQAIQRRASRAGFKFESVEQVWEALQEELDELRATETPVERAEEVGDVLFAVTSLARWYEIDGEDALRDTSRRFSKTFTAMETMARDERINLDALPLEDKLALWERAKAESNA